MVFTFRPPHAPGLRDKRTAAVGSGPRCHAYGMSGRGTGRLSVDPEAAARVRRLLSGRDDVVERTMVGGLSFLVNGNMCCGVTGTALMIRVGADGREQALREPHVRPMLLGGRVLSGFICIEPAGYAADDALASWVRRGLDFASGLPAKPVRTSS